MVRDLSSTATRRRTVRRARDLSRDFPVTVGGVAESKTPGGVTDDHGIERVTVVYPRCLTGDHVEPSLSGRHRGEPIAVGGAGL